MDTLDITETFVNVLGEISPELDTINAWVYATEETDDAAHKCVTLFTRLVRELHPGALEKLTDGQIGRLLAYSRNGEGTGFFDCDELTETEQEGLQKIARAFGECSLYWDNGDVKGYEL